MKVFIDTNVVIDLYQRREPFYQAAEALFQYAWQGDLKLIVSATTIINSFYILRKAYPKEDLYAKMKSLFRLVTVSPVDSDSIAEALSLEWKDFEDCVQYASSKSVDADVIVTRNKGDYESVSIPVMTPIEFLDSL